MSLFLIEKKKRKRIFGKKSKKVEIEHRNTDDDESDEEKTNKAEKDKKSKKEKKSKKDKKEKSKDTDEENDKDERTSKTGLPKFNAWINDLILSVLSISW